MIITINVMSKPISLMHHDGGEIDLVSVKVVEESPVDSVGEVADVDAPRCVCSLFPMVLEH